MLQASLYRPNLDLVVFDGSDEYVAHGLFWYDPETANGLVEPMGTEETHRRQWLARYIVTAGQGLLADEGAERIEIPRPDPRLSCLWELRRSTYGVCAFWARVTLYGVEI
jgi:hypothetical protein